MAFAGLAVALFSHRVDRRRGVATALLLLAIPTALLATMPSLPIFAALRVLQGVFMATAFTLTLAYLGEACSAEAAAGAFAAYITGNVASNLFGRLLSAGLADHFGLSWNFLGFALLNLAGAALAAVTLRASAAPGAAQPRRSVLRRLGGAPARADAARGLRHRVLRAVRIPRHVHLRELPALRGAVQLGPMMLGVVYLVFLPSIFTTPLAGRVVDRLGWRRGAVGGAGRGCDRPAARCCSRGLGPCWSGWCSLAWVRFSRRRSRPAWSGTRHGRIGRWRAVSICLPTISAV